MPDNHGNNIFKCLITQEKPTVSLSNKQQLQNLMSLDKLLPIDGMSPTNSMSPTLLSPGDMSPSSPGNAVSPNSVRFRRFGKKKTKTRHQVVLFRNRIDFI